MTGSLTTERQQPNGLSGLGRPWLPAARPTTPPGPSRPASCSVRPRPALLDKRSSLQSSGDAGERLPHHTTLSNGPRPRRASGAAARSGNAGQMRAALDATAPPPPAPGTADPAALVSADRAELASRLAVLELREPAGHIGGQFRAVVISCPIYPSMCAPVSCLCPLPAHSSAPAERLIFAFLLRAVACSSRGSWHASSSSSAVP